MYVLNSHANEVFSRYHLDPTIMSEKPVTDHWPGLAQVPEVCAGDKTIDKDWECVNSPESTMSALSLTNNIVTPFQTQTQEKAFPLSFPSRPHQELYKNFYQTGTECVRESIVEHVKQNKVFNYAKEVCRCSKECDLPQRHVFPGAL